MTSSALPADDTLDVRARLSLGSSADPIYRTVAALVDERRASGLLADVGCGTGNLWRALAPRFTACIGIDAVAYDGLPDDVRFLRADLDRHALPIEDAAVDVAASVETIEHLENPRALVRELTRIVRPGGWVIVTTPNQLSVLSLLTLVVKQQFSAFQDGSYPAHRTALLAIDLRRIAAENGLVDATIRFTSSGRIPLTGAHYPAIVARWFPRVLSDNVVLIARKPA